jgi:hypothetical protein
MPRSLPSRHRAQALVLTLLALAVGLIASLPAAATAATAASQFPYCSWWMMTTTPETANVAFPDAAATYWTTPFPASDELSIEIDGTYPDARYMSFNVYDDEFGSFTTNGVSSGLADYLIAPSAGAVNPFQVSGSAGGAFSLTLNGDPQPGQPNTLPLAPSGAAAGKLGGPIGYLVYRTYLPTGGHSTVALPTLTLVDGASRVTLPRCPAPTGKVAARATDAKTTREAAQALAKRLEVASGAAARAALKTTSTASPGRSWPIRSRAAASNTAAPTMTPPSSIARATTPLSSPPKRQRAAVEAAGGTFVPLSTTQPRARQLLILRNMLPNENFAYAIQSAPQNGDPTSTAEAMGAFYPRAYRCTLAQSKAGSPQCG